MDRENLREKENKMGTLPIGKLLAGMAIPMMFSMLAQAFYNVVDSIFVARVSQDALNAVSLAFPLQNLMIAFGGGIAVGMNALLSRALGERNQDMVDRSANTAVFITIVITAIFMLIGAFASRAFFLVQTKEAQLVEYGTQYATICLVGSAGIFSQFCFERMLQSTGKTHLAMITQVIGAMINIIFDPILIFGLFGFPRLEIAGAAIATVAGQIVAAVTAIIMNVKKNHEIKISISKIRWDAEVAGRIFKVGFPSILMQSVGSVMTFTLNQILLTFTKTATLVFGAYFKLQSFIFMPVFGLNNGMVPIVAYNYGAKNEKRVKRTVFLTILTAMCIMAAGALVFELFPETLLGFFDADAEMLKVGVPALRIIATHFVIAGFCIIAGSVCQAIGNPFYSLVISVCRQLVVLLPAAWLLAQSGRLELVWLAFPIAEIASLIMSSVFLRKTMKTVSAEMNTP